MTTFHGTHILAFDVQMPRLWDTDYNPASQTRHMRVRRSVLESMIKPTTIQIHVRVPFNPTLNENQLETLMDSIYELDKGFQFKSCVNSEFGVYQQTWIFVRS